MPVRGIVQDHRGVLMNRRWILVALAWVALAHSPAFGTAAVDLSSLPAHPRFFLTSARLTEIRAEVAVAGSPKYKLYQNGLKASVGAWRYDTSHSTMLSLDHTLCLAMVGIVEADTSYLNPAVRHLQYQIANKVWDHDTDGTRQCLAYDWLCNYLTQAERDSAVAYVPRLHWSVYYTQRAPPYYNLECNQAVRRWMTGIALYDTGQSSAYNEKLQALVDNGDARMRGVREAALVGGTLPSLGGVLPCRQKYFPDGGYYKGAQYGSVDIETIAYYLAISSELGLGDYWGMVDTYVDNIPEYFLQCVRPDLRLARLQSGTDTFLSGRAYDAMAMFSQYHQTGGIKEWMLNNGPWATSWWEINGGYAWAPMVVLWKPVTTTTTPADIPLGKFWGQRGMSRSDTTKTWAEKTVIRSAWNIDRSANNDALWFDFHAGPYFGDYWNYYQLAFELYYRGALAVRSGFYMGGGDHLDGYNSRAISTNSVVVLDPSRPDIGDIPGQDKLYDHPGPPSDVGDVSENGVYDTSNMTAYDDVSLVGGSHAYYARGILNPASAYYSSNATRHVSAQSRETVLSGHSLVVHDRVMLTQPGNSIRFLLHTINEPTVSATATGATVPGHITTYPRASYTALRTETVITTGFASIPTVYNGKITVTPLLPATSTLRVVGGSGYEFWVDDGAGNGVNYPAIDDNTHQPVAPEFYTDDNEVASWRVETIAPANADSAHFLNVLQVGTPTDAVPSVAVLTGTGMVGCEITGDASFVFNTTHAEGPVSFASAITTPHGKIIAGMLPKTAYNVRFDIGAGEVGSSAVSDSSGVLFLPNTEPGTFTASTDFSDAYGACCEEAGLCTVTAEGDCIYDWTSGGTCEVVCAVDGSCCTTEGVCTVTSLADCDYSWTEGGVCSPNPCVVPGACCTYGGNCSVTINANCDGTSWISEGTCTVNPCPQFGSCCSPGGSCQVMLELQCQWSWSVGWDCDPNLCPQPAGACCNTASGACNIVSHENCVFTWLGVGVECSPSACVAPPVELPRRRWSGLKPIKTNDFSIGIISYWHGGGPGGQGLFIPGWFAAQDPKPLAILHAGDDYISVGTNYADMVTAFAAQGLPVYSTLGNHDFDVDVVSADGDIYPNGESPIDDAVATAIPQMAIVPYWTKDVGSLRFLFLDNNYDTTTVQGGYHYQCYAECNPPGRGMTYWEVHGYGTRDSLNLLGNPNGTNPEYAGWVTSDSTNGQLAWIKTTMADFGGTFAIAVAHRSPYTPYEVQAIRPPDLGGRSVGWAIASRAGIDLAATGDCHSCGFTKRMLKGVQSDDGTYFITTRVAFRRTAAFGTGAGTCQLTEDDVYWPKSADLEAANESPSTVFAYIVFHGNRATVKMMQGHSDGSFSERSVQYIHSTRGIR